MTIVLTTCCALLVLHVGAGEESLWNAGHSSNTGLDFLSDVDSNWWSDEYEPLPATTESSGSEIAACLSGSNQFSPMKRIRADSTCSTPDPDQDLEDLIEFFEQPLTDEDYASVIDEEIPLHELCPDLSNLGHILPVCSSGFPGDISYPSWGDIRLEWCTLSKFWQKESV
jgi:hypothetical protein